ncbi:DUF7344 domain-containing protein [Haloferax larsenii]|uniref:DUF7344 domain-containing protein n=1 Tax=Haloferax larsenii TaxID=302484 RepID=A0A1H7RM26_HALLR|nr:hypothetical protein [Haloferax larsenii]SEL61205.1 hypothetical protein SAMN04488691_10688 [Haloferax larsenii]
MTTADQSVHDRLDAGEIHDVLRNNRRRLVLEQLREREGSKTVGDLAEHIAEEESGESPPPKNVRQSVYISLHQTHLPKLDALEIVDYDSVGKEVSLAEHAAELTPYYIDGEDSRPAAALTFASCLAGLALVVGEWMGVPLISWVDPRLVALVSLAFVAVVTGVELREWTQNRA